MIALFDQKGPGSLTLYRSYNKSLPQTKNIAIVILKIEKKSLFNVVSTVHGLYTAIYSIKTIHKMCYLQTIRKHYEVYLEKISHYIFKNLILNVYNVC